MATTQIDGGRQIKAATITNAEIAASAAIATSKLANGADFIQRGGSVAFTADQSMGGFKLTSLGTPTASTDAATKAYVDATKQGLDTKDSVRVATTSAGTLATDFENGDTVDGVVLSTGDRILIKDQASGSANGIYVVAASGSPTRASDADSSAEVTSGMYTYVEEGTANGSSGWVLNNTGTVTLGTTALTFTQFSGAGQITAGDGLTKTGNTLNAVGTANRISVSADAIDIGTDVVTLTGSQTLTNKTLTTPTIGSFANAAHDHTNAAGGGQLTDAALSSQVTVPKGGTGLTSTTAYAILAGGTTSTGALQQVSGLGSSGQVLTSNGAGALPTWEASQAVTEFSSTTITGSINGSNTSFTLGATPNPVGSEQIFLNGILQEPGGGNDYTISGATVTYLTAPVSGDKLRAYCSRTV